MKEFRDQLDKIDEEMRILFEKRMDIVSRVGEYKANHHIPVLDKERESAILNYQCSQLKNKNYLTYYKSFIKNQLSVSKHLQEEIIKEAVNSND